MSLSSNNNKETFKLLDVSSETDSDVLQLEIVPRKRRLNRSRRSRNKAPSTQTRSEQWGQRAAVLAASAALLAWLAALSWAAAALAADTHRLDAALREVSMGSQSVGDALQRCHSAAKELLHNHTEMAARLDQLVLRTDNLTAQVKVLHAGLTGVEQQVAGAPELVAVPQRLADLQTSVARVGSQLKDMGATVDTLRGQAEGRDALRKDFTRLENQVNQLWNRSTEVLQERSRETDLTPVLAQQAEFRTALTQLAANVSQANATLASMISWATQDYKADHRKVEGLLEAVQNNSAALSSLQTAWRQGNDVLNRNISDLSQQIADKSAEFQRQFLELKQLQEQLEAARALQARRPPGDSSPVPPEPTLSVLAEAPKLNGNPPSALPGMTKVPIPLARIQETQTGKPSILSAGVA